MHADPVGWKGILLILVALVVSDLFGRRLSKRVAAVCLAIGVACWLVAGVLSWITMQPEPARNVLVPLSFGWCALLGALAVMAGVKGLFRNWERKRN